MNKKKKLTEALYDTKVSNSSGNYGDWDLYPAYSYTPGAYDTTPWKDEYRTACIDRAKQYLKNNYPNIDAQVLATSDKDIYHIWQANQKNPDKAGVNAQAITDPDKAIHYFVAALAIPHKGYIKAVDPYNHRGDWRYSNSFTNLYVSLAILLRHSPIFKQVKDRVQSAIQAGQAATQQKAARSQARAVAKQQAQVAAASAASAVSTGQRGKFSAASSLSGLEDVFDSVLNSGIDVTIESRKENNNDNSTARGYGDLIRPFGLQYDIVFNDGKTDKGEYRDKFIAKPINNMGDYIYSNKEVKNLPKRQFNQYIIHKVNDLAANGLYQNYDAVMDAETGELVESLNRQTKINIRESLNAYDVRSDNKYDLRNLYDSCILSDAEKRTIAEMISKKVRANVLYEAIMNKFQGKPLTESLESAKADMYSIEKFLDDNKFYNYELITCQDYPMQTSRIVMAVEGDWKHDHLYFKELIGEWAEANNRDIFKIDRENEPSDSDYYKATYYIYITKDRDSYNTLNSMRGLFGESIKLGGGMSLPFENNYCIFVNSRNKTTTIMKVNSKKEFTEAESMYGGFVNVCETLEDAKKFVKSFNGPAKDFDVKTIDKSLKESFLPQDEVEFWTEFDHKWLPGYKVVKKASPDDLRQYGYNYLKDYDGDKYVIKCIRDGLFSGDIQIELEKNLRKANDYSDESLKEDIDFSKYSVHPAKIENDEYIIVTKSPDGDWGKEKLAYHGKFEDECETWDFISKFAEKYGWLNKKSGKFMPFYVDKNGNLTPESEDNYLKLKSKEKPMKEWYDDSNIIAYDPDEESLDEDWYDDEDDWDDSEDKYTLVGVDGNAYAIMGYTANALKREGLRHLTDQMYKEATSGDYYNLIAVCCRYVDKANAAARGEEV